MAKLGVSLRIDDDKIEELDQIAKVSKRDRTFVINEAIETYLEINKWQLEHIKKSLAQADQGKFAQASEVDKALKKWR
jgi:predicted transcriptional regulator